MLKGNDGSYSLSKVIQLLFALFVCLVVMLSVITGNDMQGIGSVLNTMIFACVGIVGVNKYSNVQHYKIDKNGDDIIDERDL